MISQNGLPSIITKEQATGSDKKPDHDRWRRRASDIVGLVPAHGDGHGDGGFEINPGLSGVATPFASRTAAKEGEGSMMAGRRDSVSQAASRAQEDGRRWLIRGRSRITENGSDERK